MAANEELFELMLRHAIAVRRLSSGEVREMMELLRKSEEEILEKLQRLPSSWTSRRYKALIADIREMRKKLFSMLHMSNKQRLMELARAEQDFQRSIMDRAVPVKISYATASAATLNTLVTATPFAGGANAARSLSQWWATVSMADQRRIVEAIQLGMVQGEGIPLISGRVMKAMDFTRRNAEAIVRTAVNHVSNGAREAFFAENASVAGVLRWVSTLDGRTSAICRARDGHFAPTIPTADPKSVPQPWLIPPTARPPAHPNCRSVMVAVLNPLGLAGAVPERPFVRDARTGQQREMDFRADAHASVGDKRWSAMSVSQRNAAIAKQREAWAREAVGRVPGDINYDAWLRKQPVAFQNEVLGRAKAVAFRKGLRLDQFVDRAGHELTLEQLYSLYPEYGR